MMKNVVVLGADGLLASDLVELLQYEGVAFKAYSKELCDITKHKSIYYSFVDEVSHVFNCAAITNIDICEKNPELANAVNNNALSTLTEICLENEIHLTHFSTAYVFDGAKKEPYSEYDVVSPLSIYGKSKLAGEGHVLAMGDKGLVIRTNLLFGKYKENLVNSIIRKLEKSEEIELEDDEFVNPTYTIDLANIALLFASKSGLYNATNAGNCSKYELGLKIAEYMNMNAKLVKAKKSTNALIPKYSVLSSERLDKTLPERLRTWEKALYQYLIEIEKIQ